MRRDIAVAWFAVLALASATAPVRAQSTGQGAVTVQGSDDGKLAERATKVIGGEHKLVVPEREVIVVKRVRGRPGWWKSHRYRVVTVYYDGHRFYRRHFHRSGLRRIVVYERAGRYYIDEDHWKRKHRHRDRDRHGDRDRDD